MGILVTWCGLWASNGLEICLAHVLASISIDVKSSASIDTYVPLLDSFLSRGILTTPQYNGHNFCYRMLIDLKPVALES
ncbi:hypothetical protein F2Q68_00004281 [Brassica cretica]|uniref:Uncharacterized protein n=1 Tax=Brassica cretica TaxID=69181 RepID=A0A8S9J9M6_BRACR|nr:hypothetical protein F2Q68_00004281 [Brassica cretica]